MRTASAISLTRTAQARTPSIQGVCQVVLPWPSYNEGITLAVIRCAVPSKWHGSSTSAKRTAFTWAPVAASPWVCWGEDSYVTGMNSLRVGSPTGFLKGTGPVQLHTSMTAS